MAIITSKAGCGFHDKCRNLRTEKKPENMRYAEFGYDPNNKSLDIYLKRQDLEWDGAVIAVQLNILSPEDREAIKRYLDEGL